MPGSDEGLSELPEYEFMEPFCALFLKLPSGTEKGKHRFHIRQSRGYTPWKEGVQESKSLGGAWTSFLSTEITQSDIRVWQKRKTVNPEERKRKRKRNLQ